MKRFIITFICLMTMIMSANAQRYYSRHYYPRHYYSRHYYPRHYYSRYYYPSYYSSDDSRSNFDITECENTILGGVGVGKSYCDGNFSSSTDIELIIFNALVTTKIGKNKDKYSTSIPISVQLGYLFKVLSFGGKDFAGRKHNTKVFVSPLVGIGYTEFGGEVVVKHQFLYAAFKATHKGLGFSIGLAY